jgi:hypothetical protein
VKYEESWPRRFNNKLNIARYFSDLPRNLFCVIGGISRQEFSMSSRQLEELQEREQAQALASTLKISIDDLDRTVWDLVPHESEDGLIYGYNVEFSEGSDPEVLARISGLVHGSWVRIGPNL